MNTRAVDNYKWKEVFSLMGLLLLFCTYTAQAQKRNKDEESFLYNAAKDFIAFEDYESALELFHALDSLRPGNPEYVFNVGLCSFRGGDKPKSLLYFLKAYQLGYRDDLVYYYMGLAYHFNYDMDNAVYYLEKYLNQLNADDKDYESKKQEAVHLIKQIRDSKEILDRKLSVDIENMGGVINSAYADYVPLSLSKDSTLIFTSRRAGSTGGKVAHDGFHYEDIYLAVKNKDGEWQEPKPFPGFNGKHHDANVAINNNETELYIYKARHNGDIYKSIKDNSGRWSKPKPLNDINTRYWEGSLCLSPDENTIYFSSDRPGGYGGSDLYSAVKDAKGRWVNIQNLGPEINTPFDEDSPYLYKDGQTFFFSSKGHNAIGGYDVFSAKKTEEGWKDIRNIGFPINTIDDDIYFQLNSNASLGYFTSIRHSNFQEKSVGEKDLFQIKRPYSSPVYFVFKGRVYDEESKEPLPAIVTLKNLQDSLSADQKLVVDINSGKFRYNLKFDNRYKLTVEVGDKVYYSKELYFPYQPDLFETFIDIPLKDVPSFRVKLNDILLDAQDTSKNIVLDNTKHSTIVLVRKVPYNDPELRDLLVSRKIPATFRKRLFEQLKDTPYLDIPEEGELSKKLFDEFHQDNDNMQDVPAFYTRLESGEVKDVKRVDVKSSLANSNGSDPLSFTSDSTTWNNLSDLEKNIIERLTDFVLAKDTLQDLKVIDELYLRNLSPEESVKINQLVAANIFKQINEREGSDKTRSSKAVDNLYKLIDHTRNQLLSKGIDVKTYNREAWGVLYTVEASRFKYREQERISFRGRVIHRSTGEAAPAKKLLLTDDFGMIYAQGVTTETGHIEFSNLLPGKRYHILVDDYAITLLGRSRYELHEMSVTSNEEGYLQFYNNLTPEQKRSIDRIVAVQTLQNAYHADPKQQWEDPLEFSKLSQSEKDFIERVRSYLAAKRLSDSAFFMHKKDAFRYEQMNTDLREDYNRFITRGLSVHPEDSLFYNKLTELEKSYVEHIRNNRNARKTILDDILISQSDADYWYVLDEINTKFPTRARGVKVSGKILNKATSKGERLQVALMDEFNQIVDAVETDASGSFSFPWISPNKKFKVLINKGENIGRVFDYQLSNVKIEAGEEDFYLTLSDDEKRIVDRIIAINLANEFYKINPNNGGIDSQQFEALSTDEKDFIERLRKHLFADTVTRENIRLQKNDNHHYYHNLTIEEREFINRYVVKNHFNKQLHTNEFTLQYKDRTFFNRLNENQKDHIRHMQEQRKAKADIFAENPVLIVDKTWVVLDSINASKKKQPSQFAVSGYIVNKSDDKPAYNVPVMLSTDNNDVMGIVSTDSAGYFHLSGLSSQDNYYILAETKRNIFSNKFNYRLKDLKIAFADGDSVIAQMLAQYPTTHDSLSLIIVYFNFDSYSLTQEQLAKLHRWINANIPVLREAVIQIHGYTDSIGSDAYNLTLSQKRANAIRLFLIEQGLDKTNVTAKGFGERKPRYSGKESSLNRRVEFVIIKH